MSDKPYQGEIKAKIFELRFASSGKVSAVFKKKGDLVKKGEVIASLDRKILQAQLDRQLADFERVRAEFEIFNLQKGEPSDDVTKYLKVQKQAQLNASVKEVESAKASLDQMDMFSPVEGIIIDDSNLVVGLYVTPSSNPVKVLETASFFFEFEIEQVDLNSFIEPKPITIRLTGLNREIAGNTRKIIPSEKAKAGKYLVEVNLQNKSGLLLGMQGETM